VACRARWAAISHNGAVTGATGGKRAGSRRGPRRKTASLPVVLALALGITLSVVAWGYLVYAAIDFGASARGGSSTAWAFLALASVGAVACLFFGLMLVAHLLRHLGITKPPPGPDPEADEPDKPRPIGGRRAAR